MHVNGEVREMGRASGPHLHPHASAGNWELALFYLSLFCRRLITCWVSIVPPLKQVQKETLDENAYWRNGLQDKSVPEDLGHNLQCFYPRLSCMLWGIPSLASNGSNLTGLPWEGL